MDGATQKEFFLKFAMADPGEKLYWAARDGKTEDVRRLLAEKAPLEYKDVRHHPPQTHNPPPSTRALSVAKGAAERA